MEKCPRCAIDVPAGSRFCPSCGAILSSVSQMPTQMSAGPGTPSPARTSVPSLSSPIGRLDSGVSGAGGAGLQAGQMLAGRYRVIGLLGRGGMGDVYRADDLELSQPVALKFLGRALSARPEMLERFRAEVRNARQVSHPNVCRVYDIGELDGQHFLSMEYVDGEDLATLLKRIGRLPRAKADEVARQICVGLAAAHDRGVIHRDLKPSNIMIDGEGRVRVTDFGLAVRTEDGGAGDVVGTPAYMAPEQFDGKPATAQTDLYAVGLILYEVYTGRRPLDAATWDGWRSQHSQVEPRSPEEVERDVEEPVARAILRCLEKDPARRPNSALQLAASLPGGDPLAAALAAGETPSPQMVAASGGEGSLAPRSAWRLLGVALALLSGIVALAPAANDLGLAPLTTSVDVLAARARDVVVRLGYTEPPRDGDLDVDRDYAPMRWRAARAPSTTWRREYARMGPPILVRWRQSPRRMFPLGSPRVADEDPPLNVSGMVDVVVDGSGRLRSFTAVPPELDSSAAVTAPGRHAELFSLAGLDTARFHEVAPSWVPLPAFETRREWLGTAAWLPGVPLRVTAAWWRKLPVAFALHGPWSQPTRMEASRIVTRNPITAVTTSVLGLLMIFIGVTMGRRGLQGGRADWRGGLRIAFFIVGMRVITWILIAHHNLDFGAEFRAMGLAVSQGLLLASIVFFLYVAFEAHVRRRTPELLIGWTRVLHGRLRDPRVGRDALLGSLFGCANVFVLFVVNGLPSWVPFLHQTPIPPTAESLIGGRVLLGALASQPDNLLVPSFSLFGIWFLLRLVFKRGIAAAVGLAVVMTLLALGAENPVLEIPGALVTGVLTAWLITRTGLLALTVSFLVRALLLNIPLPFAPTSPYAFQAGVCLLAVALLFGWAFRVSLGGRAAFSVATED